MFLSALRTTALATLLGAAILPSHAQTYTAVDLGLAPSPFDTASQAAAINNAGDIVGTGFRIVSGVFQYRAALFTGTGTGNIDLGTLGGTTSYASDINDSGTIIGRAASPGEVPVAVRYSGTGSGNASLGALGGGTSAAYAINNSGIIVGSASDGANSYATRFSGTGLNNTKIAIFDGSYASGLNEFGVVAGTLNGRPALFDTSGSAQTEIGALGGSSGSVYAINDAGVGVAVGVASTAGGKSHAARFNGGYGNNTDLGTLGTGDDSYANSINNSGRIVGVSNISPGGARAAFYYDGTMKNLLSLVTTSGVTALTDAAAINDWGQIAATGSIGFAISSGRAFRLDPNVPLVDTTGNFHAIHFVGGKTYNLARTQVGGLGTVFTFLGGTIGVGGNHPTYKKNRLVNCGFSGRGAEPLASDVATVSGLSDTGYADPVAVQIAYDPATASALLEAESDARLGWKNSSGEWVLATDGNTGGAANFVGDRAYNSALDITPGTHGVNTVANTVWAVVNHSGQFAAIEAPPVIPTPSITPSHAIGVKAKSKKNGKVKGGGTFLAGSRVTVTAIPEKGHAFVEWREGKKAVSKKKKYAFTVAAPRQLVAIFE